MTFAADSEALIEGAPLGDWREVLVRLHRFIGQQMKEKLFCFVGVIVMLVNGRLLLNDLASWMQFVKLGETSTGLYIYMYIESTC